MPFVDPAVIQPVSIPVVFPEQPSFKAIQAAGIVTSYFGIVSADRPVRFPVRIGAIPQGNVIVIAENPASLPAGFNLSSRQRPYRGHARPTPTTPTAKFSSSPAPTPTT